MNTIGDNRSGVFRQIRKQDGFYYATVDGIHWDRSTMPTGHPRMKSGCPPDIREARRISLNISAARAATPERPDRRENPENRDRRESRASREFPENRVFPRTKSG